MDLFARLRARTTSRDSPVLVPSPTISSSIVIISYRYVATTDRPRSPRSHDGRDERANIKIS